MWMRLGNSGLEMRNVQTYKHVCSINIRYNNYIRQLRHHISITNSYFSWTMLKIYIFSNILNIRIKVSLKMFVNWVTDFSIMWKIIMHFKFYIVLLHNQATSFGLFQLGNFTYPFILWTLWDILDQAYSLLM